MGRGDQRTKRGKIATGTFGNTRPRKKNIKKGAPAEVVAPDTNVDNKTDNKEA